MGNSADDIRQLLEGCENPLEKRGGENQANPKTVRPAPPQGSGGTGIPASSNSSPSQQNPAGGQTGK